MDDAAATLSNIGKDVKSQEETIIGIFTVVRWRSANNEWCDIAEVSLLKFCWNAAMFLTAKEFRLIHGQKCCRFPNFGGNRGTSECHCERKDETLSHEQIG